MSAIGYWVGVIVFMGGLIGFVLNWGHLIMTLMFLEVMVLSVYYLYWGGLGAMGFLFVGLFYISLAVCEGCLGLSVFVNMICSEGSDKMGVLVYLEW